MGWVFYNPAKNLNLKILTCNIELHFIKGGLGGKQNS